MKEKITINEALGIIAEEVKIGHNVLVIAPSLKSLHAFKDKIMHLDQEHINLRLSSMVRGLCDHSCLIVLSGCYSDDIAAAKATLRGIDVLNPSTFYVFDQKPRHHV